MKTAIPVDSTNALLLNTAPAVDLGKAGVQCSAVHADESGLADLSLRVNAEFVERVRKAEADHEHWHRDRLLEFRNTVADLNPADRLAAVTVEAARLVKQAEGRLASAANPVRWSKLPDAVVERAAAVMAAKSCTLTPGDLADIAAFGRVRKARERPAGWGIHDRTGDPELGVRFAPGGETRAAIRERKERESGDR